MIMKAVKELAITLLCINLAMTAWILLTVLLNLDLVMLAIIT